MNSEDETYIKRKCREHINMASHPSLFTTNKEEKQCFSSFYYIWAWRDPLESLALNGNSVFCQQIFNLWQKHYSLCSLLARTLLIAYAIRSSRLFSFAKNKEEKHCFSSFYYIWAWRDCLGFAPCSQSFAFVASPQPAQSVRYPEFVYYVHSFRPQIRRTPDETPFRRVLVIVKTK